MSNSDINITANTIYTLANSESIPIIYFKYHNGLIHICESEDFEVRNSNGGFIDLDRLFITYENLKAILEHLETSENLK